MLIDNSFIDSDLSYLSVVRLDVQWSRECLLSCSQFGLLVGIIRFIDFVNNNCFSTINLR